MSGETLALKAERKERRRLEKQSKAATENNAGTGLGDIKKKKGKAKMATADVAMLVDATGLVQRTPAAVVDSTPSNPPTIDSASTEEELAKKKRKREKRNKRERKEKEAEDNANVEAQETATDQVEETADVLNDGKKGRKRNRTAAADGQPAEHEPEKSTKKRRNEQKTPTVTPTSSSPSTPTPDAIKAFLKSNSITIHTPPSSIPITPILSFAQLPIPAGLQASFGGFTNPTPIQACAWPAALSGKDVVGVAETGSGKTLAFGIPALARLMATPVAPNASSAISVLVVAPTRELAIQTHDTLSELGRPFGIGSVAVFGGVAKDPQVALLRNMSTKEKGGKKGKDIAVTTRIIVGTPGRILDLMQEGVCDLSCVDYLVLDEADRMLDKGFENDIRNIISNTKPGAERQTMMFSATWPEAVRRLASTFQNEPVRITVGSDDLTANSRVEQVVEVFEDARSKDQRLLTVLRSLEHKKSSTTGALDARILVFALYKKEASRVEQMLSRQGYSVGSLHGDMSQSARMDMLERFKSGETGLMVATDVAARGLDIPNVGAVVNYTFPLTIEDYIHRIGRTGRGGKSGKSITFFTGEGHERALAGEFARVLGEGGFKNDALKEKFPMTIKKKEHSVYGAFYRDDIPVPEGPTKIVF